MGDANSVRLQHPCVLVVNTEGTYPLIMVWLTDIVGVTVSSVKTAGIVARKHTRSRLPYSILVRL